MMVTKSQTPPERVLDPCYCSALHPATPAPGEVICSRSEVNLEWQLFQKKTFCQSARKPLCVGLVGGGALVDGSTGGSPAS